MTYTMYQALVSTYKTRNMDTATLAPRIDLAYALGRLTDEEYQDLIQSL